MKTSISTISQISGETIKRLARIAAKTGTMTEDSAATWFVLSAFAEAELTGWVTRLDSDQVGRVTILTLGYTSDEGGDQYSLTVTHLHGRTEVSLSADSALLSHAGHLQRSIDAEAQYLALVNRHEATLP